MPITLRPYQLEAVEAAYPHQGYALFMEQRTGKTIVALELHRRWKSRNTLVICPKKAIPVWKDEIKKVDLNPAHFTIVNFESFVRHEEDFTTRWDLLIIDESHRIKNRGSQQTKACWRLGRTSHRRLILTGTPQGNGMEDYYAQLRFIRPLEFSTWGDFSDRYLVIEQMTIPGREDPFPKIVGYRNEEEFKARLKTMSFRVLREEVATVKTLVKRKIYKIDPSPQFRKDYRQMKKQLFLELGDNLATAPSPLTQAMKLHQLCGGFIKDDMKMTHHVNNDKLNFFWNLVDTQLRNKSFTVVANFKAEMDEIARGLEERKMSYVQIRGKYQYNPKDRSQVTILNPSAGEAINLSHYSEMVIFSMNYSFLKWRQFLDRIVLVDTPEVRYHYLMMKGMADEIVYSAVIEKRRLNEIIMKIFENNPQDIYNPTLT